MNLHKVENQFRGYPQVTVSAAMNQYQLSRLFAVFAVDMSGFTHRITHLNDPKNPDVIIFPE